RRGNPGPPGGLPPAACGPAAAGIGGAGERALEKHGSGRVLYLNIALSNECHFVLWRAPLPDVGILARRRPRTGPALEPGVRDRRRGRLRCRLRGPRAVARLL